MNATRQVLINCTMDEEHAKLAEMCSEITVLLHEWKAHSWSSYDLSADAVVAMLDLRHAAELRMAYIDGWGQQTKFPF